MGKEWFLIGMGNFILLGGTRRLGYKLEDIVLYTLSFHDGQAYG